MVNCYGEDMEPVLLKRLGFQPNWRKGLIVTKEQKR